MLRNAIQPSPFMSPVRTPAGNLADISDLPPRLFTGPANADKAIRSMLGMLGQLELNGLAIEIEITGVGGTNDRHPNDKTVLLDSVAERLIAMFRDSDLVTRTGQQTFVVIAATGTEQAADLVGQRLSKAIGELLTDWRRAGIVACCAISRQPLTPTRTPTTAYAVTDNPVIPSNDPIVIEHPAMLAIPTTACSGDRL